MSSPLWPNPFSFYRAFDDDVQQQLAIAVYETAHHPVHAPSERLDMRITKEKMQENHSRTVVNVPEMLRKPAFDTVDVADPMERPVATQTSTSVAVVKGKPCQPQSKRLF